MHMVGNVLRTSINKTLYDLVGEFPNLSVGPSSAPRTRSLRREKREAPSGTGAEAIHMVLNKVT